MSPAAAPSVWKAILAQGAVAMGSNAWNKLRVIQGTELFRSNDNCILIPCSYFLLFFLRIYTLLLLHGSMLFSYVFDRNLIRLSENEICMGYYHLAKTDNNVMSITLRFT
jgi:hypothetical protein